MQNTDAVAWTKKLVGIESTNPGTEEYEIAGFLEHEIRAVLPERGELKKDYTRDVRSCWQSFRVRQRKKWC